MRVARSEWDELHLELHRAGLESAGAFWTTVSAKELTASERLRSRVIPLRLLTESNGQMILMYVDARDLFQDEFAVYNLRGA